MKTLEEYLELYAQYHSEKYNFQLKDINSGEIKTISKGITSGELTGFKAAFEIILKDLKETNENSNIR